MPIFLWKFFLKFTKIVLEAYDLSEKSLESQKDRQGRYLLFIMIQALFSYKIIAYLITNLCQPSSNFSRSTPDSQHRPNKQEHSPKKESIVTVFNHEPATKIPSSESLTES